MAALKDIIIREIDHHGPIDIGRYMTLALSHPEHGYYAAGDPFGKDGDFITSPEVSQLFGEMIGIWCAHLWLEGLQQKPFHLVECGPGRGTLMADLLRATAHVPGFHDALDITFIEINDDLKKRQKKAVKDFPARWQDSLAGIPQDGPVIMIANEFLDALPIRQLVYTDHGWAERVVAHDKDRLCFGLRDADPALLRMIPKSLHQPEVGQILELSPSQNRILNEMADVLKANGGAALLIDYGYTVSAYGETLQALRGHAYAEILDQPGQADLTAHVNFNELSDQADQAGLVVYGPSVQGDFLSQLGIGLRAEILARKADTMQRDNIEKGLKRLTNPDQMGTLFKVMGLGYGITIKPPGFERPA